MCVLVHIPLECLYVSLLTAHIDDQDGAPGAALAAWQRSCHLQGLLHVTWQLWGVINSHGERP